MAGYPRLRARLRRLERERLTLERFLDGTEKDPVVGRTHADTLALIESVDDEINELQQIFLFAQVWTISIWLLPVLLLMVSISVIIMSWG